MSDRQAAARAIEAFLVAIGRDPAREPHLTHTGERVADAYLNDLCAGYAVDARALLASSLMPLATRDSGQAGGLVVVRDLCVSTTCPHHLLPAIGKATIAFVGRGSIVGIGTLAALAHAHTRRLAIQEEITEAIVSDLEAVLRPEWVACRLALSHACAVARGERATGSWVETVAYRGATSAKDVMAIVGGGPCSP